MNRTIAAPKLKEREIGRSRFSYIEPYLYLVPFFIGVIIFTLYPIVNVVLMSFKEEYSFLTRGYQSIGLANYRYVLTDSKFINSIGNTLTYVAVVVPLSTCIAVVLAYLLNGKLKLTKFYQTAFFLPMVTAVTAVGLIWRVMYNKESYGIINYILSWFGVSPVNWLYAMPNNMTALTIFGIWNIMPFTIILLLSGLQNIDEQYYIAARVDGAKSVRIFMRITVPLLAPTICLVLIINSISSFKVFTEIYTLWNGNPGCNYNMYSMVLYIREIMIKFETGKGYGYAASAAIVLFLFILAFTMIQRFIQKKWANQ